jgi:sodium transport system ATP-binding protein
MVSTKNVGKSFKDGKKGFVRAVDSITFDAVPGKIFGLLGVNGAGKTTLLRILSTVLTPTEGTATVCGFDTVSEGQSVRSSIGFLSTSTALYGRLSAEETIEYFAGFYGLRGQKLADRVNETIERLEIGPFKHRLCDKLSTGQKQRVSIARAIVHDPPVLFFDEPTAGLDVVSSQTVMEFIESSRSQGKTIIFSTHIMSEVQRLCDEVAVIHEGRMKARGTVDELIQSTGQPSLEKAFLKLVDFKPSYFEVDHS